MVSIKEKDKRRDELETLILQKFAEHFDQVYYQQKSAHTTHNRCSRELDMGEVLNGITGWEGSTLEAGKEDWFGSLVSTLPAYRDEKPLRCCSDRESRGGPHKWHARAFDDGTGAVPAKKRIRELRRRKRQPVSTHKNR